MKMTVVPAQVTTVEDRIIGNLGFSQILLLIVPIFVSAGVFVFVPPFMNGAIYKYILMAVVAVLFCILAVRIKSKIVALWLVMILHYNVRPKYYLFNKNVTTLRENFPSKKNQPELEKTVATDRVKRADRPRLDTPTTVQVLAAIENPAARVRFETGKKGELHVRFTEIKK